MGIDLRQLATGMREIRAVADSDEAAIEHRRVSVVDGHGACPELALEVLETDAGEMVVRSTRAGERPWQTIEASELQLVVLVPAAQLEAGDVAAPAGTINGRPIAAQTLAVGRGVLLLTDQRALGLVYESDAEAASLAATVDDDGNGSVLVFAVQRDGLEAVDIRNKRFGGGIDQATLDGSCLVGVEPLRVLDAKDRWRTPQHQQVEGVLRSFAGT